MNERDRAAREAGLQKSFIPFGESEDREYRDGYRTGFEAACAHKDSQHKEEMSEAVRLLKESAVLARQFGTHLYEVGVKRGSMECEELRLDIEAFLEAHS